MKFLILGIVLIINCSKVDYNMIIIERNRQLNNIQKAPDSSIAEPPGAFSDSSGNNLPLQR